MSRWDTSPCWTYTQVYDSTFVSLFVWSCMDVTYACTHVHLCTNVQNLHRWHMWIHMMLYGHNMMIHVQVCSMCVDVHRPIISSQFGGSNPSREWNLHPMFPSFGPAIRPSHSDQPPPLQARNLATEHEAGHSNKKWLEGWWFWVEGQTIRVYSLNMWDKGGKQCKQSD